MTFFDILKGSADPTSPRSLTPEGLLALQQVERAIENQFVTYIDYSLPLHLLIFNMTYMPTNDKELFLCEFIRGYLLKAISCLIMR